MRDGFIHVAARPAEYRLSPGSTALVVLDMQLDALAPQGHAAALGHDVTRLHSTIEPIAALLDAWRSRGWPVLHTREVHQADLAACPAWRLLRQPRRKRIGDDGPMGRYRVAGEYGSGLIPEVGPVDGELVVDKPGKGMFWATRLHETLTRNCITHLVLTGATADGSVQASLREADDRGYECLVVEDATESYRPELKAATLAQIASPNAAIGWHATSNALLRALRQRV
jgi:nicotinamidase-related amidase